MGITVQNITSTTAWVTWSPSAKCADSFYSVMYRPNWNSLITGYSRKNFLKEDRIPGSQTSTNLGNLNPQTTYILCVTCQSANPSSDQCRIFNTLGQDASSVGSGRKEIAMGIWLTSSILLLIIAGILLYGCLHIWCRRRQDNSDDNSVDLQVPQCLNKVHNDKRCATDNPYVQKVDGDGTHPATIIENPFIPTQTATFNDTGQEMTQISNHEMNNSP
ncbi:fibronectin type III domain-containing protein 9 [Polypterus senegalus]|uniref:fibronectin type III domain-containing protein 9 n=1 Tax=Polypterus senegalus TaxID=55291 RepID=UPI001965D8F1|nr:fibronectin type III domain-containing protein 9 [Polypterus senegalus]